MGQIRLKQEHPFRRVKSHFPYTFFGRITATESHNIHFGQNLSGTAAGPAFGDGLRKKGSAVFSVFMRIELPPFSAEA